MAQRKRKNYSTTVVFVLLFCFSPVPSGMCLVTFKDVDISENWQRAKQACKNENMKLARIDNIDLFNSAKTRVYKGAPSQENFWTGLKYEDEKLVWSGGREAFCNGTLSEVLDCAGLKKWDDPSCFLITSVDDTLQPSKCDSAQIYLPKCTDNHHDCRDANI